MLRDEHFDGGRTGYERNVVQWALHPAATARRSRGDNDLSPVPVRVFEDAPYHFIAERFANSASHAIFTEFHQRNAAGDLCVSFQYVFWNPPSRRPRIYIT